MRQPFADGASWPRAAAALGSLPVAGRLSLAAAAGASIATSQPPLGFWPVLFLAGPVLFWLWRSVAGASAFWTGWAAGCGFFSVSFHWIVEPFLVDAAAHLWIAPFAAFALCGGMALFWGAGFWAAAKVPRRWPLGAWATLTIGLTAAETTRSSILTGFPWGLPAYVWTETPVAQTVAIFGPYALSLLTIGGALAPGLALGSGWRRFAPGVTAATLLAVGWGWGAARLAEPVVVTDTMVRILQTNVEQRIKWEPENVRPNFDMLLRLTRATEGSRAPDIVIWPESAVTFPIDMAPEARAEIAKTAGGAEVAVGSLRLDGGPAQEMSAASRWRNSLFLLNDVGEYAEPFDKVHLVPFGEYFPFDEFWNRLGVVGFGSIGGGLIAGESHVIMRPASAPPFAPLICYEMIFPGEARSAAEGASWMVLVTNDAWFGGWAGPEQHLAKARFRAIENGLPIARSANVGVSAMIDPYGRALGRVGPARELAIDAALPAALTKTFYRYTGEGIFGLLTCILIFVAAYGGIRTKGLTKNEEFD